MEETRGSGGGQEGGKKRGKSGEKRGKGSGGGQGEKHIYRLIKLGPFISADVVSTDSLLAANMQQINSNTTNPIWVYFSLQRSKRNISRPI